MTRPQTTHTMEHAACSTCHSTFAPKAAAPAMGIEAVGARLALSELGPTAVVTPLPAALYLEKNGMPDMNVLLFAVGRQAASKNSIAFCTYGYTHQPPEMLVIDGAIAVNGIVTHMAVCMAEGGCYLAAVLKRGSAGRSGRSSATQKLFHSVSLTTARNTQPSPAG